MRFTHPDHPGRPLRLAYCLNLHPADSLDGVLDGVREITAPLARRLRAQLPGLEAGFGVGPWLPAEVAVALARPEHAGDLERFAATLATHELDAFTWNAFPFGRFHEPGLKQRVFSPGWNDPARLEYTLAVARVAAELARCSPCASERAHVSLSTHTGLFGTDVRDESDLRACAAGFAACVSGLARLEEETGQCLVLSLEAEPRASAGDTAALAGFLEAVRDWTSDSVSPAHLQRHLGVCLDACHAAVEFESAEQALRHATAHGTRLGKVQFSSALRLPNPAGDDVGRERLLAMAEPVYLHQVTGRRSRASAAEPTFERATDLPEVRAALARDEAWLRCDEWRCHFHVPVDLEALGAGGLTTTAPLADELLLAALADPSRWGTDELHVEIETYTWNVLPGDLRRGTALVDGLEAEYAHVLAILHTAGWLPNSA